jgi:hypothetical protein
MRNPSGESTMAMFGFVCYCPDLRLYRYVTKNDEKPGGEGDVDYKFDDVELENVIATHIAQDQQMQAQVMAQVTGLARLHPHKIVRFSEKEDKIDVVDPVDHWKEQDAEAEDKA